MWQRRYHFDFRIPAGTTYSLRSILNFAGCVGCDFQLEGTLKSSTDLTYWATQPAIIYLNGISGAKFHSLTGAGVIDGNGQDAYDEFAVNSSLARPTALYIVGGSRVQYLRGRIPCQEPTERVFWPERRSFQHSIRQSYHDGGVQVDQPTQEYRRIRHWRPRESTYTTINDVYVSNQDDCIAFKSGSSYVTVERVICAGALPLR